MNDPLKDRARLAFEEIMTGCQHTASQNVLDDNNTARSDAHREQVNVYERRFDRLAVIVDSLCDEVVIHNSDLYPAKVVRAVSFLDDEMDDTRDELARIDK